MSLDIIACDPDLWIDVAPSQSFPQVTLEICRWLKPLNPKPFTCAQTFRFFKAEKYVLLMDKVGGIGFP
jgi:hypothetical protein